MWVCVCIYVEGAIIKPLNVQTFKLILMGHFCRREIQILIETLLNRKNVRTNEKHTPINVQQNA